MRVTTISKFFGALAVAALIGSAPTLQAQTATTSGGVTNQRVAARRAKLQALTPDQRKAAKKAARRHARKHTAKHARNMTPAQKTWAKSATAERSALRAGVRAGTITKESAAAQRKAWVKSNPRPGKQGVGY